MTMPCFKRIEFSTVFNCTFLLLLFNSFCVVICVQQQVDNIDFGLLTNIIDDDYGYSSSYHRSIREENPDVNLTTPELIERYGYTSEIHEVTTNDGYILTLHRIPNGKKDSPKTKKSSSPRPVAFVQHGIFSSSADWILNRADKALPYLLADAGYDVWLGNARGNIYSKKHVTLTPEDHRFWDFSFHDMGTKDIPSVLDYILDTTGQPDLYYIGHSMGTTMFFVCLSEKPEYNQKIRFMAAMGPAVYLNHMSGVARFLAPLAKEEKIIFDLLGHGEMLPQYLIKYLNTYGPDFCTDEMKIEDLCENVFFVLAGFDPEQANKTELPVILAHTPTTSSTKTLVHFFQGVSSGKFRQYDYGYIRNKYKYGTWTPPKYDLSKVKVPVVLYHGPNDLLVDPKDVARLANDLPGLIDNVRVNLSHFNHIDFLFAKDVDILVNKPLLKLMKKF